MLIGLFFLGLLFRLLLMKCRFVVAFDEVNYLKLGVSGYLNGIADVLHAYWTPLLPALISFSCYIFPSYEFAARFVSALAGAFLVFPLFFLCKAVYDETVALLAAGFVAFYPPLAFQSTSIYTEAVYMLFGVYAIWVGLKLFDSGNLRFALLAGFLTGLLYLLHPLGVGFLVVLLGWTMLQKLFKWRKISLQQTVVIGVLLAVGFLLPASVYLLYLKDKTGVWTISSKAAANQQFRAHDEGGEDYDPFRALDMNNETVLFDQIYHQGNFLQRTMTAGKQVSAVRLGDFLRKYAKNVYAMMKRAIPSMLTTVPVVLLSLGLLGTGWKVGQGEKILYLLSFIGFFWFLAIPAFHITERYLTPLWPICALFVANGYKHMQGWLREYPPLTKVAERLRMRTSAATNLILVATVLLLSFLPELGKIVSRNRYSPDYWAPPIEQKTAGLWLRDNTPAPRVMMSRYQTVDIYAGNFDIKQSITIPDNELPRVVAYARNRGVNYIVLNERYKEDNPRIAFLYESEENPDGLKQIYARRDATGYLTKIYQVL